MNKITDVLPKPIKFAVYRYGYTYVIQENQVLIIDNASPPNVFVEELPFQPTTFGSGGGRVCLYHPQEGAASFIGNVLSSTWIHSEMSSQGHQFSAPFGLAVYNEKYLAESGNWHGLDLMGMPIIKRGPVTNCPFTGQSFYDPLLGAMLENNNVLTFQRSAISFGQLNGIQGELIYCNPDDLPQQLIPYSYAAQNLHGAGMQEGYLFTPDGGRSWQKRRLSGFGVITERAILDVSTAGGVQVVVGIYP